jgi:hypothetical protein
MADQEPSVRLDFIRSSFYLDNRGQPVNGFEVGITLLPWNEAVTFNWPTNNAEQITAEANKYLAERVKLSELLG